MVATVLLPLDSMSVPARHEVVHLQAATFGGGQAVGDALGDQRCSVVQPLARVDRPGQALERLPLGKLPGTDARQQLGDGAAEGER